MITVPADAEKQKGAALPSTWAQKEIVAAQSVGLVPKGSDGRGAQVNATRRYFAQLIARLVENALDTELDAHHEDVYDSNNYPLTDCYDAYVRKAYYAGLVTGTSVTEYSPNALVTRQQLAAMLWRAVGYINQYSGSVHLDQSEDLSMFSDARDILDYATVPVASLAKNGILQGSEGRLNPTSHCSIEQAILLSYRTLQKVTEKT